MDGWNPRRVILPFTYGKDSLLSPATLSALGYEVILVHIGWCCFGRLLWFWLCWEPSFALRCGTRLVSSGDTKFEGHPHRNPDRR